MAMKAAVIDVGRVAVESLPDPTPEPREVVVAVAACGICGTDLHIADGEFAPTLPVTPGHEFAGEVVAVGTAVDPAADGVRVGDQVAVDPSLYCGECYFCRRGRGNLCDRWGGIGVTTTGGAAEYVAAPVANCVVLPDGVRPVDAALIEPLSCAVHGIDVLAPAMGDHYLIYGAGTMGLMLLELAKRAGAASVSMVDPNPARLETARELGCSAAVAVGRRARPATRVGQTSSTAPGSSPRSRTACPGWSRAGRSCSSVWPNTDAAARFSPFTVYNQEIRIVGSMAVLHSFERAAQLFAEGVLRPDVMISDRKPLDDYPAALEQFRAGVGRKIQVRPR